ncbi:MAG TPA: Rid family hydrolase [Gaiellaceae bacterium]|jgi:2-iminobutanoate/2-iminopropanoate deaminase|nr:Rid family hydrolase [Gaiellaceae bacterium]
MAKTAIVSSKVPAPAGAYSPGLAVGEWLFLSGQGGFDPATGELASTEIEGQTEQAFRNVDALLEEAGLSRNDIVSCLVHLSDLSLFPRYNAVYERQLAEPRPVRTTVGASLLGGMLIELTVIAHREAGA